MSNFLKLNLPSQRWRNGNTEVAGKSLTLNCTILKWQDVQNLKFGEDAI